MKGHLLGQVLLLYNKNCNLKLCKQQSADTEYRCISNMRAWLGTAVNIKSTDHNLSQWLDNSVQ